MTTVAWKQTILTPPLRQRTAPTCDANSDGSCPAHYQLQGSMNAATVINGVGLPGGDIRVGHFYIDNPNPVAVRVTILGDAWATWYRGRDVYYDPFNYSFPFTRGCMPIQTADGSCYSPPDRNVEEVTSGQTSLASRFHVFIGGREAGACSGCGATERELPANTTADVWVHTDSYSFLWGPYPIGVLNDQRFPSWAIGGPCEQWIHNYTYTDGTCCYEFYFQNWWYLTRLKVVPAMNTILQSRPADSRADIGWATGTNTANFAPTPSVWNTNAFGQPSF
jgi:hypothetical protein